MVHNERIKLLAAALNNLGLAFAIGGFVAPAISGRLAAAGLSSPALLYWLGLGAGLHLSAQLVLGRLKS